ncbi:MAG: hypothetical protein ACFFAU_13860 [Candidatus Hodarchaeota archaeon]
MEEPDVVRIFEYHLRSFKNVSDVRKDQKIISDGLVTDLMSFDIQGKILHIAECKGSVSIGKLAKGIGQAYQYKFQAERNLEAKDAEIIFVCPKDSQENLNRLKIPKFVKTYLIGGETDIVQFNPIRARGSSEIQIRGTFYIEGFEIKFVEWALKAIINLTNSEKNKLDRDEVNQEILRVAQEAGEESSLSDHRNTLITLSNLNIIDNNNFLTPKGYRLYGMLISNYDSYKNELVKHFYPFLINIQNALIEIAKRNNNNLTEIRCTQKEIGEEVCRIYGREVRYFNNPRRISTMLKICTEIGMIEQLPGNKYHLIKLISPFLPPI